MPRGDEALDVRRIGHNHTWYGDLYVDMLAATWGRFAAVVAGLYFFSNLLFAVLYYLTGGIENIPPGSFLDYFFFSIQTMSTIGYGRMAPISVSSNILVTLEALWGFAYLAVVTGMVFARFSHPTARVLFSDVAVIGPYNGKEHLMMRIANERDNRIINAHVEMFVLRDEISAEGVRMRRFHRLKLASDHVPLMRLTWTVMHPIDKDSPLYGMGAEALEAVESEIIVLLNGFDETMAQQIHARHSYIADEIVCDSIFDDIITRGNEDYILIDYSKFHSFRRLGEDGGTTLSKEDDHHIHSKGIS